MIRRTLDLHPAYEPLISMVADVLLTPDELAAHWSYGTGHLANLRKMDKGPNYVKLPTGAIRYPLSEVVRSELSGTHGALTIDRVCLAIAATRGVSLEAKVAVQEALRAAFPNM